MKIKRLLEFASASVLSLSTLMTLGMPLAHAVTGITCTWTGATDLKFSTATNWSGCTGANNPLGTPVSGDIIAFGSAGAAANNVTVNLVNDLTGKIFGGVISNTVLTSSSFKINTIALAPSAQLSVALGTSCYPQFARITYGTLSDSGALTINDDAHDLSFTGVSIGGNLTLSNKDGFGYFVPATGSTVGGNVIVSSPLTETTATGCSSSGKVGGGFQSGSNFANFTMNGLTVQNGANTSLGNVTFPVTLGGGTATTTPFINFYGNIDSNNAYIATTYSVSGAVNLLHDATLYAGDKTTVTFNGAMTGVGFALTKDPTSIGSVTFAPSSNSSNTVVGTPVNAPKTTTVSNDQSSTFFQVVPNETLVVDGKAGNVNLLSGAKLMGNGTVGILYAPSGSIVAPGHSPGCLASGDLILAGTYQAEIGGTDPCTGYDQIKVTGTVNLAGSTLDATLYGGFVPKVGQSYTIINNDAADAVTGTFTGIANGGTYSNQGVTYTVNYDGVDGNDVVLTVKAVDATAVVKKPDTGFALVSAHPLLALVTSTLAAAAILVAARKLRPSAK